VLSFHRILEHSVGRVLLAVGAAFMVIGTLESIQSVAAAAALAGFGLLWIRLGTLDQRTAARVLTLERDPEPRAINARRRLLDREQFFAARADVTVLLGVGWLASGWLGLVTAAVAATG
jgi:hypothetical protein